MHYLFLIFFSEFSIEHRPLIIFFLKTLNSNVYCNGVNIIF